MYNLYLKKLDSDTIKIIETFNKKEYGWLDNANQTRAFTNRKIFSVLPDSEIFRTL